MNATLAPALPPARRDAAEQDRLHQTLTDLWERRLCFNELLGLRVRSLDPMAPQLQFTMRPDLVGHYLYGRLHGGVISAVLDATGGFALNLALAELHAEESTAEVMHRFARMGTIDLRVDYLRPGLGRHFIASAEVSRLGRRIASTLMRLHNDEDELIATGAASYVVS